MESSKNAGMIFNSGKSIPEFRHREKYHESSKFETIFYGKKWIQAKWRFRNNT